MIPPLIPLAHGGLLLLNVFIVSGWLIFSFLFWLWLRRFAVEEDRIFDLTFFATGVAFIFARLGYVFLHREFFVDKSLLLVAAIWVSPGLSWIVGMIGGVMTVVLMSRQYKVRLGLVLDALAAALPLPLIIGKLGSFIIGIEPGKIGTLPFGAHIGNWPVNFRHPVALYEAFSFIVISFIIFRLMKLSVLSKWAYGIVGVWFFLLYSISSFVLEFFKDSRVYWGNLTANQWMLIGIFAECVGVLYVRGGGREFFRPYVHKITIFIGEKGKYIHESISRRHTR